MKTSTTLTYYKQYKDHLYRSQLEREDSDHEVESREIASDVQQAIDAIMAMEYVRGKITITIEAGK